MVVPVNADTSPILAEQPQSAPVADPAWFIPPSTPAKRAEANLAALEVLQRGPQPGDQEIIAKWSGWGALPEVFETREGVQPPWAQQTEQQLRALLSETEFAAAKRSILNAHYTSPDIAKQMWDTLEEAGWTLRTSSTGLLA